jgi:hypothetical protein
MCQAHVPPINAHALDLFTDPLAEIEQRPAGLSRGDAYLLEGESTMAL